MSRRINAADVEAWLSDVFAHSEELDPDWGKDWADLAFGWLLGRGIDPDCLTYDLLSAFVAGDRGAALATIRAARLGIPA